MKKGQRFFVIERQAGAGNEHVIAGSMEEVERIVKDTLGRPTDNRVGEINEVEVVGKYTAEVKIEPEPLYMEWKNVISDKMEGNNYCEDKNCTITRPHQANECHLFNITCQDPNCPVNGNHSVYHCKDVNKGPYNRITGTDRRKELISKIIPYVYPTTQMVTGIVRIEDYITSIARMSDKDNFAEELSDRRIFSKALPLFRELGEILRSEGPDYDLKP